MGPLQSFGDVLDGRLQYGDNSGLVCEIRVTRILVRNLIF